MSVEQCEQYRHSDATWHRPTWRLGESPINVDREDMGMRDIHELFAQRREAQKKTNRPTSSTSGIRGDGFALAGDV